MAVFRLYNGGPDTYLGWNGAPNPPYNNETIATILDPMGGVNNKEITSIPSPFARIDLIKSAFEEVNRACNGKTGQALCDALNGDTIYHKMISDSLDVGEIFFNVDKLKDKVQILVWNPSSLSKNMSNACVSYGQKCYNNSLLTYWQADAKNYNFDQVNNIYILNYIGVGAPRPLNVIGATSPATLFFSNANDLSYVQGIQFGQDKPFDDDYQPLYKRDDKFIEYLWWLRVSIPGFANWFPEFYKYLDYTYSAINNQNLKNKLNSLQNQNGDIPEGLKTIDVVSNNASNFVEVLGNKLLQKQIRPIGKSDFTIKSTRQPQCNYLVLPVEAGNRYAKWVYTTDEWGTNNYAPAFDENVISQRRLPFDNTPQPYLTISDFLEDNIVASPHRLNNKYFYDGEFYDDEVAYLLPLKPLFFEFFSSEELIAQKMLKMENVAGFNVRVTLSIPTYKGVVEYSRLYSHADANIKQNEGHIVDADGLDECDVLVQPAIEMPKTINPYYTLASIVPYGRGVSLSFFDKGKNVPSTNGGQIRNENFKHLYKTVVYTVCSNFECIQVNTKEGNGLLLPMFPKFIGGNTVSYSVDLGTSNTHMEYIVNGNTQKCSPFEYFEGDNMQTLAFLPKRSEIEGVVEEEGLEQVKSILARDFMPDTVKSDSVYHFPTRTVLSYSKGLNWDILLNPLELTNICLPYGKQMPLEYNDYATDIKWSDSSNAQSQVTAYVKNILLQLRNKTLSLGGDLDNTSLTWFYPTSMTPYRRNLFQNVWNTEFHKMFGNNAVLNSMSESVAPVNYHTQNNATAKDMLTIDIGGGTTDMAFASQGNVNCVTSFRFAANALFEDSFSKVGNHNGIVEYFKLQYYELAREVEELRSILTSFDTTTANMANTLFTLADVPCVRDNKFSEDKVDFVVKLRNDHTFKLEFIIFYAAILYHAGKIISAENLTLPRHIAFSGNGSNVLKVLVTPDAFGKQQLADFSKVVLEKASGVQYGNGSKLEILGLGDLESPKCATCKGGLLKNQQIAPPKTIVLKSSTNELLSDMKYSEIDETYIDSVVKEVYAFFGTLKNVDKQYSFVNNFGLSDESWKVLNDILCSKEDIKTFVSNGVKARMEKEDASITETFFFYPIASILQQYSLNMLNLLKDKNDGR